MNAMRVIQENSMDAQIIFGLVYKDELELGDEVLVTVIATGFDSDAEYDEVEEYAEPRPSYTQPGRASSNRRSRRRAPADFSGGGSAGRRTEPSPPSPVTKKKERPPSPPNDQPTRQNETDWDIPAFLRVQKKGKK